MQVASLGFGPGGARSGEQQGKDGLGGGGGRR